MEKLIPLYVEGDLEHDRAASVRAHLGQCQRCSLLADQCRGSQNWLRSYAAPTPDSEFFNDLRKSVLADIAEMGSRRTRWQFFPVNWSRKPVFAVALALLMIFAALAFYAIQEGVNSRLQRADNI
ncbi:MAG TPA: zf-HC2 domain-containing protein, partial [Blastocatellia bacterium]|nr:zf-HC2 domain-containing protein [Blastocatellia bacterium]